MVQHPEGSSQWQEELASELPELSSFAKYNGVTVFRYYHW